MQIFVNNMSLFKNQYLPVNPIGNIVQWPVNDNATKPEKHELQKQSCYKQNQTHCK